MPHVRNVARAMTLGLIALVLVLAPGGASAAPKGSTPLDASVDELVPNFCDVPGLTVHYVSRIRGWETIKPNGKYAAHAVVDETYTANGVTLTSHSKTIDKDLRIVDPGDGTLQITVLQTGNATIYGPDGKAIARNPGQVRFLLTIDAATGEELSFELIKGSTGRSDDACTAMVAAFTA